MESGLLKTWKAVLILVLTSFLLVGILTVFSGQNFVSIIFFVSAAVTFLSIVLLFLEKLPVLSSTENNPLFFGATFIIMILGANLVFLGLKNSWIFWLAGLISFLYTILKK